MKDIDLLQRVFFDYPPKRTGVLTALPGCYMAGATWNCCSICAYSVYTIQPCISLQCHFMQSHVRTVHVCLAVTCYLHFWQNDRDLLRSAAVTRQWKRYQNKSQHRKLTVEQKILPPLLLGLEPVTFWSLVRCSNHWAIPAIPGSRCSVSYLAITSCCFLHAVLSSVSSDLPWKPCSPQTHFPFLPIAN